MRFTGIALGIAVFQNHIGTLLAEELAAESDNSFLGAPLDYASTAELDEDLRARDSDSQIQTHDSHYIDYYSPKKDLHTRDLEAPDRRGDEDVNADPYAEDLDAGIEDYNASNGDYDEEDYEVFARRFARDLQAGPEYRDPLYAQDLGDEDEGLEPGKVIEGEGLESPPETGAEGVRSKPDFGAEALESEPENEVEGLESEPENETEGFESKLETGVEGLALKPKTGVEDLEPKPEVGAEDVEPTEDMEPEALESKKQLGVDETESEPQLGPNLDDASAKPQRRKRAPPGTSGPPEKAAIKSLPAGFNFKMVTREELQKAPPQAARADSLYVALNDKDLDDILAQAEPTKGKRPPPKKEKTPRPTKRKQPSPPKAKQKAKRGEKQAGKRVGKPTGQREGQREGHRDGYREGYREGYRLGYREGHRVRKQTEQRGGKQTGKQSGNRIGKQAAKRAAKRSPLSKAQQSRKQKVDKLTRRRDTKVELTLDMWEYVFEKLDESLSADTSIQGKIIIYAVGGVSTLHLGARGPSGTSRTCNYFYSRFTSKSDQQIFEDYVHTYQKQHPEWLARKYMNADLAPFVDDEYKKAIAAYAKPIWEGKKLEISHIHPGIELIAKMGLMRELLEPRIYKNGFKVPRVGVIQRKHVDDAVTLVKAISAHPGKIAPNGITLKDLKSWGDKWNLLTEEVDHNIIWTVKTIQNNLPAGELGFAKDVLGLKWYNLNTLLFSTKHQILKSAILAGNVKVVDDNPPSPPSRRLK